MISHIVIIGGGILTLIYLMFFSSWSIRRRGEIVEGWMERWRRDKE